MSDGNATSPAKTRHQLEKELLEALTLRREEWKVATDGVRFVARQRFMDALQVFNDLAVRNNNPPA